MTVTLARSPHDDRLAAELFEEADAPQDASTPYTMEADDVFLGTLDAEGDRDWVAIELTAGMFYDFALFGTGSASGLYDPYLRLYDSDGDLVDFNDDYTSDLWSLVDFSPTASGTYYLEAGAYLDSYEGDYELYAFAFAPTPLDELAEYLTDGFWDWFGGGPRSFDTSASTEITVNLGALDADAQQLARWALEAWEAVADLQFREVAGGAQIDFDDEDDGAYAFSSVSNGDIVSSFVNVSRDWLSSFGATMDSYSFLTYIHEIGHALGLGHLGPYNGVGDYGFDNAFPNDSWLTSVMSYFDQDANTYLAADYALPVTAMLADVVAIQALYGAPDAASATAGNTVYGANATIGGYLGLLFDALTGGGPADGIYAGGSVAFTLYDRGGRDTIDLRTSATDDRLDLRPGELSDLAGLAGNLAIARGTLIENAYGGSGHDKITGNAMANLLSGGSGNDDLHGLGGRDRLFGNGGRDELYGGGGGDALHGGFGGDWLYGGQGADALHGGAGADRLYGGAGRDRLNGGTGNDICWGGGGADVFIFAAGDGRDRVMDFDEREDDRLLLDADLWAGNLSPEQVVGEHGSVTPRGHAVLAFDGGEQILLRGFADLDALADQLLIA